MHHRTVFRSAVFGAVAAALALLHTPAKAEHCWAYVDGDFSGFEFTKAPFSCVEQGDPTSSCSWNPSCTDGVDCCMTIPDPSLQQTILQMHTDWHSCFGNTGSNDPPLGRSARWLAFHRQFEFDFDLFREQVFSCSVGSCVAGSCSNDAGRGCATDVDCSAFDGCFIENLDWHKNMLFPYGQGGAGLNVGEHPVGCGTGPNRPGNVVCSTCRPLPACLYNAGAGPINGDPPTPANAENCLGFQSLSLGELPTMEDVAKILDSSHHGTFHGEVGRPFTAHCMSDADCAAEFPGATCDLFNQLCSTCSTDADCASHPGATCDGISCVYNTDVLNPSCSPRDPMFWRLHKRLDDTVRAWQEKRPFDLSVVVDRSGSMSETDQSGTPKIAVVTEALEMLADLLPDAQSSRVGVVSYSTNVTEDMTLTGGVSAASGIQSVADGIEARVGGRTSIGSGLEAAADQLCNGTSPGGDASCHPNHGHLPAGGENERKGVLLLTDGLENEPRCLNAAGGGCSGQQFDFDLLGPHTQLCAIGFGQAQSINGTLLTLLAERQGGIYMQSPAKGADDDDGISGQGRWVDLKDFFVKCFGQVSDEFVGIDPKGTLLAGELATEPMEYGTCDDERLTFVAGWNVSGDPTLRLMVNAPSGALVRFDDPLVESSRRDTWSFLRTPLPLHDEAAGTWRAQLIRRHNSYANGFTTDALPPEVAVPLVRQQIQRLCVDGCSSVLYFEDGHLGPASSYEAALAAELEAGLLGSVTTATSPADFNTRLQSETWNLVVYAHQLSDQPEPYDALLSSRICAGQRAIVTETRGLQAPDSPAFSINQCAGAAPSGFVNFNTLTGDDRLLEGSHTLTNHGYSVFSYGQAFGTLSGAMQAFVVATAQESIFSVISADEEPSCGSEFCYPPPDQEWSMNVLVRGTSKLDDAPMRATFRTGESGVMASARVLPANLPRGGYDQADVRVELQRPMIGLGQTLLDVGQQAVDPTPGGDGFDARTAALASTPPIQTTRQIIVLNDDGVNGDVHAANAQWSAQIPDSEQPGTCLVDGMYRLHFTADFTKNGCTTRRELVRTTFVDVGVDPEASGLVSTPIPDGVIVDFCPQDRCGNPSGWGRKITCGPDPDCTCDDSDIVDHGDGCYTVTVHAAPGAATCTVGGTGKPITVPRAPACLLASETLNPRDRSLVTANVHAGSFSIGNDARIQGAAFAVGDGFLGQRSTIDRDATLGGVLEGNRAGVLGTLTENTFVSLPLLVRKSFGVGSGSEVVPNDASVTLSPGLHGNAIWRSRSRVTLTPGTYAFASLEIEPDVIVNAAGTVVVNAQGQLNIGDRSTVLAESPESLELYSNASQMRIGTDVVLSAIVVAPDATVTVFSRTDIAGCVGGRNVTLEPDVVLDGSGTELPIQSPAAPTCTDGVKNGSETDIDCGGPACPDCAEGRSCAANSDCVNQQCSNGRCQGPNTITATSMVTADWGSGYCVTLRVTNNAVTPTTSWELSVDTSQSSIYTSWNGSFSASSGAISVAPSFGWNESIPPGGTDQSIGFCADRSVPGSGVLPVVLGAAGVF